jgi:hypothetical protein
VKDGRRIDCMYQGLRCDIDGLQKLKEKHRTLTPKRRKKDK